MQNFLAIQEKNTFFGFLDRFDPFLAIFGHLTEKHRKTDKTHDLKGCQLGLPRILVRGRVRGRVRVTKLVYQIGFTTPF